MDPIYIILLIAIAGFFLFRKFFQNKFGWIEPSDPFSTEWRTILIKNVAYYNSLSNDEKSLRHRQTNCWNGRQWLYGRNDDSF
jgi:hypothetical protein